MGTYTGEYTLWRGLTDGGHAVGVPHKAIPNGDVMVDVEQPACNVMRLKCVNMLLKILAESNTRTYG